MTPNRPKTIHHPSDRRRSSGKPRWIAASAVVLALGGATWVILSTGASGVGGGQPDPLTVTSLRVEILRELTHDITAYTQGLLWQDGWLYESTGQYGESRLNRIDLESGDVVQQIRISPEFFGEGLALVDDRLIMLTYKAERAFVFDRDTFEQLHTFTYRGEGWGLCRDRQRLVMSDGSHTLTFRDPLTFEEVGSVAVTLRGRPQTQLNELECVGERVYANVYQEDYLVVIDPETGRVTHQIDASGLLTAEEARTVDVLNGIAYAPDTENFYITGKDWPKMFAVRFVE